MFTANPHAVTGARLLRSLDYDEAQEIASSGAKVLHPRCILPAKQYAIPLSVHATQFPEHDGTVITTTGGDGGARVKAVCVKKGITLVSMETLGMWHQVGFLADAFSVFKDHGLVDRPGVHLRDQRHGHRSIRRPTRSSRARSQRLVTDLSRICRVEVIGPVRGGEPGRPQYPRHDAPARRRARAVRGAEDLPGHAGRERPQPDLRRRRGAGRPAGAPPARTHRATRARGSRARADLGADPRAGRRDRGRVPLRGGMRGAPS